MISFQNMSLKIKPMLKIAGLGILAVIAVYIIFIFLGSIFGSFKVKQSGGGLSGGASYNSNSISKSESSIAPMPSSAFEMNLPSLSTRNSQTYESGGYDDSYGGNKQTAGNQAENYEVTEYNADIETRQLEKTCAAVSGLKAREDVIFETAREYSDGCNYTFKVAKKTTGEILALINGLKPKELIGNTYTIQGQIDDYTSRTEILQKQLAAIDETLTKAAGAYDEVAEIATDARDVESLAKVVDRKINTIERLAQQRISINSQLDQIQRAKLEQTDRLEYTYFSVNIASANIIDWQNIKDSWNYAARTTIGEINRIIQNISINLIGFLFGLLQYAVYALILLIVAKYGWRLARRVWRG